MAQLWRRYKECWDDRFLRYSISFSFVLFVVSVFIIQPYAIEFTNGAATNPVGDLVLSNIPVFNVGIFFVYGMFLLVGFITVLCLQYPKRAPFVLFSLTLFVLTRSIFVSLTHIGSFTTQAQNHFGPGITLQFFGADHFFSGHVGSPFLMALIFWHKPALRYTFLAWSVFFAAIVLMGHLHYSIDVLAAPFITYGVYHIALWLFPKERGLFLSAER